MSHEIPRDRWRVFLDRFSKEHDGWTATIEANGRIEASDLPLIGITADRKGSEPDAVEITVGRDIDDQVTHIIPEATRVAADESSIEIESEDGDRTVLRVESTGQTRRAGG